jgi:hypothetical protein
MDRPDQPGGINRAVASSAQAGVDEELAAILTRALRAGIAPRRVLLALGIADETATRPRGGAQAATDRE